MILHEEDAPARAAGKAHAVRFGVRMQRRDILRRDVQDISRDDARADEVPAGLEMCVIRQRKGEFMHILFQCAGAQRDAVGRIAVCSAKIVQRDGGGYIGEGEVFDPLAEDVSASVRVLTPMEHTAHVLGPSNSSTSPSSRTPQLAYVRVSLRRSSSSCR